MLKQADLFMLMSVDRPKVICKRQLQEVLFLFNVGFSVGIDLLEEVL